MKNAPFSVPEQKLIEAYLAQAPDKIPLSVVGFKHNEDDLTQDERLAIYKSKPNKTLVNQVKLEQLMAQAQQTVGRDNMREIYTNWQKVPLPEVIVLKSGLFFVVEGHHRFALQMIAKRKVAIATLYYSKSLLGGKWHITLQGLIQDQPIMGTQQSTCLRMRTLKSRFLKSVC